MWTLKIFKTGDAMYTWYDKHKNKYQVVQRFINNSWALDIKRLQKVY